MEHGGHLGTQGNLNISRLFFFLTSINIFFVGTRQAKSGSRRFMIFRRFVWTVLTAVHFSRGAKNAAGRATERWRDDAYEAERNAMTRRTIALQDGERKKGPEVETKNDSNCYEWTFYSIWRRSKKWEKRKLLFLIKSPKSHFRLRHKKVAISIIDLLYISEGSRSWIKRRDDRRVWRISI